MCGFNNATCMLQICFVNCCSNMLQHLMGCIFWSGRLFTIVKTTTEGFATALDDFFCVSIKKQIYLNEAVCDFVCGFDRVCVYFGSRGLCLAVLSSICLLSMLPSAES